MRRSAPVLSVVTAVLFLLAPSSNVQSQDDRNSLFVQGRLLVKLRPEAGLSVQRARLLREELLGELIFPGGAQRAEVLDSDDGTDDAGVYVVQLQNHLSVMTALKQVMEDPRVEYAEPDYLFYPTLTPNDSLFDEMWGLQNNGLLGKAGADIGATSAWDLTTGSHDVVVAVTDTGVDLSHPDLAANAWVNPGEVAGNGVDDDGNGLIDDINGWNFIANNNQLIESREVDFHGTHVAGTIGAVGNNGIGTTGVSWQVRLMSLKFLGSSPGSSSNAVRAINYAIEQKRNGVNVRVINASWGGSGNSQSVRKAIKKAGKAGIVFVCAAGNGGEDSRGDNVDVVSDFPTGWSDEISSLIPVAALDRADSLPGFSNYGLSTVSVAAPGVSILSTVPGGGFGFASGTSMATPHVSGLAALLAAIEPSLSPAQIKDRIIRTAEPVLSLASKVSSSGRVNAFNALSNRVASTGTLAISEVRTTNNFVFVDGLNFTNGSAVIEIGGIPAPKKTRFDDSFRIGNGTFTTISTKLGKSTVTGLFPRGIAVSVTVFNPATGERSAPFSFARP